MNLTTIRYTRKHISRNFNQDSPATHYHPETIERMQERGLTREDMIRANERRHWLACRRVHKAFERLKAVRVGYISLREIAEAAGAALDTVKAALQLTFEEVTLQLREAFIFSVDTVAKKINRSLKEKSSLEPEQGAGQEMRRGIRVLQEKCMKFASESGANQEDSSRDVKRYDDMGKKSARFYEHLEYALNYQRELEEMKKKRGDGKGVLMKPAEKAAFLQRKTAPGRWTEVTHKLTKVIGWLKNGKEIGKKVREEAEHEEFTPAIQTYANAGCLRKWRERLPEPVYLEPDESPPAMLSKFASIRSIQEKCLKFAAST